MDPTHSESQAAEQQWLEPASPTNHDKFLEQRIEELEQQVAAYDALLNELPDLFERKFQERLAPIWSDTNCSQNNKRRTNQRLIPPYCNPPNPRTTWCVFQGSS
jgi:hypothetical protein